MDRPPDWNPFDLTTRRGRVVEGALGLLVLLSVGLLVAETAVDRAGAAYRWFWRVDVVIWAVFCAEYVTRVAAARPRRRYALSFFGIVDLMAVASAPRRFGLRSVKILRVLRALRVLSWCG